MKKYFTKEGLELKYRQISDQEKKVLAAGKDVGAEAGISCDWHDNFGYENAKCKLEIESTVLKRLKEEVNGAVIIAVDEQSEKVMIGVTVKISIDGEGKEVTIGAYGEQDMNKGLIAYTTPLANGLIGMEKRDSKAIRIGNKTVEIKIIEIFPPSYRYNQLIKYMIKDDSI